MAPKCLFVGDPPNEMIDSVLWDLLPDLDQGMTALLDSLRLNTMSQRCSFGFRSGEYLGQSMVTIPSSSRNCLHTVATRGQDVLHQSMA